MAYTNPIELAQKLSSPFAALDMAMKANDLDRVLKKGMNIHLMGSEGRITIRHTAEDLRHAHNLKQEFGKMAETIGGATHVQEAQASARAPDARPAAQETVRS